MSFEAVIGLEIHTQLNTKSKIFSAAPAQFSAEPNAHTNEVDAALPGTLPVLNKQAVRLAVRFGLAIGADIAPTCHFDRKNYPYPDLPKGYQISQFDAPIVGKGAVELEMPDGSTRTIRITRAHLEEDAGRSLHDAAPGHTGIDLNRAGTPLLEIVTEPDLRTPEEAAQLFRWVHELVTYHKICDGRLNEGSMRCDANVSVRPSGAAMLGERTEIKNINSFEFLEAAIRGEIARQVALVEGGGKIVRQTLRYDPERDETTPMRTKEQSDDYRYFPEPDLLPIETLEVQVSEAANLRENPDVIRGRLRLSTGLGERDLLHATDSPEVTDFFEAMLAEGSPAKAAINRIVELQALCVHNNIEFPPPRVTPQVLAEVIKRQEDERLSTPNARRVVEILIETGEIHFEGHPPGIAVEPSAVVDRIIEDHDLRGIDDADILAKLVADVVAANPKQVEQYRSGKEKVFAFFVGQLMKQTAGKANPQRLNELLKKALAG